MRQTVDLTDTYTANILRAYDSAEPADIAAGMAWYDRAEHTMAGMAETYGVSRETVAGTVAALSPRIAWATNVNAAELMLTAAVAGKAEPVVAGMGANRRKAWAIANGADPDSVLAGPKVTAFYANLSGDPDRVTVDVWAARAAGLSEREVKNGLKDAKALQLRTAYVTAAARRGVTPRQLQAAVWVAVRGAAE